jgi:hypothetical protein|tara:strand:- start:635 stop:799 length:165 start_codon:yes stop_codon:yes gene_type:complete
MEINLSEEDFYDIEDNGMSLKDIKKILLTTRLLKEIERRVGWTHHRYTGKENDN